MGLARVRWFCVMSFVGWRDDRSHGRRGAADDLSCDDGLALVADFGRRNWRSWSSSYCHSLGCSDIVRRRRRAG